MSRDEASIVDIVNAGKRIQSYVGGEIRTSWKEIVRPERQCFTNYSSWARR
jgi:hypothetical protein